AATIEDVAARAMILRELSVLLEFEDPEGFVEVESERATLVADPRDRAALLCRVGEIRLRALGDREGALQALDAAIRVDPTYEPALAAAGRLYCELGDRARLIQMHLGEAEHATDPRQRAEAWRRAGEALAEEQ